MKALLTAVVAAIEACAVALAGVVIVAIPAVLLWWLVFGFAAEPAGVGAAVAGVWLLAHLVPLGVQIAPEAALALGLPPEAITFTISLAPLGLTLLTVLLAFRAGRRFAGRGGAGAAGVLGGALGFAAAAFAVLALGRPAEVWPAWAAVLVPALCFGVGSAAGYLWGSAREGSQWWGAALRRLQRGLEPLGAQAAAALPARMLDVLRLTGAALAGLLALGALGLLVSIVAGYVQVITLSQALQLDPLGALLLFLIELALLPVAWVWSVSWFSGAGFAIGSGSSVTPFETLLGPVPALPLLGAVPQGWGWAAALAPLLVVILGVVVGAAAGGGRSLRRSGWARAVLVPLAAAILAGLLASALAALASGGVGPGRLGEVGPQTWLVGGLIAAELGVGMVLGVAARRVDLARLRDQPPVLAAAASAAGVPLDERADARAEAPPEPQAGAYAEAETVPLDPLPASGAATVEAGSAKPGSAKPGSTETDSTDTEALLRAYAWSDADADAAAAGNAAVEAINDALGRGRPAADEGGKRRVWRLPRRKG